jgi:acetylornithine deacetylase/succinyl-diaminopimelate desuccinylase-like protein
VTAHTESVAIDWEGTLWECISHLQALIRMDTVNPPGRELGVARYLDDVLRGAGIETTLLEPAPGRAALIGRLKGNGTQSWMGSCMDVVRSMTRACWP